jgi:formylglycine-generating enzyme required for sulfatase activity
VPAANANLPAGDVSWRMAAMYCNWLHNDRRSDRDAFLSGAYDVSTFGFNGNIFTDQAAHSPGARYWIPTWDEWLKAAHYDPSKANPDGTTGGWWTYSNGSDIAFTYGPPPSWGGVGTANAGFDTPNPFAIPLGAYGVTSPYGLLDVAGGTTEWTESIRTINTGQKYRVHDGSFWTEDAFESGLFDRAREWGGELPHIADYWYGLRVAAAVPSPSLATVMVLCGMMGSIRRRRSSPCNTVRSRPCSCSPW